MTAGLGITAAPGTAPAHTVTYAVERWRDCWAEMAPLWREHWLEVARDHAAVPLDPDLDVYQHLDDIGQLHLVVARSAGRIVGYHIAIVKPHLHYRGTLHAHTDVYFIDPAFRRGMVGVRLFREVERLLKQRGVVKMITGTKLHTSHVTGSTLNMGPVFERLGWRETERTYTKCI